MTRLTAIPRRLALFVLLLSTTTVAGSPSARQIRDIEGSPRNLFRPAGKANVLVFVSSDCPISNGYAPEVQRICADARARGVACTLVYEDMSIDAPAVRSHRTLYAYRDMPAVIDADGAIARRANATVSPEAVVIDHTGTVKYRGRINNQYVALGRPRRVVTAHDLREAIDAVLEGRRIAQPETQALGCFIPRTDLSPRTPQ